MGEPDDVADRVRAELKARGVTVGAKTAIKIVASLSEGVAVEVRDGRGGHVVLSPEDGAALLAGG